MNLSHFRAAVRYDSGLWRRIAELGCLYSPEWWKRSSPPLVAAVIYSIARDRRAAVRRNQRQVRGASGWLRDHWNAYQVFAECARSMTESLEQWGPRPPRIALDVADPDVFHAALSLGRGLVIPTAHFGGWEIGARFLSDFGRPVNIVTAHEANATAREFIHRLRSRHGVNVIYSDRSVFAGLPVLQALRRNEVVGMQIDPWGGSQGTRAIDFCGRPAPFHVGPFAIARAARAPLIPVFAIRTGVRRYEMRTPGRFDPLTPVDSAAAFTSTVRALEGLVRERPEQWLMFEDVWRDPPARAEIPRVSRPETRAEATPFGVCRSTGHAQRGQAE